MALGDTLRRIVASDNFILNAAGALVGIKNPNANGLDLRVDQPAAYLPSILAQSGVPSILPSSGSSNASGQITLTTALPYQPNGAVGLYLPSGVVIAGSQGTGAAVYQVTFSSTTVCQITGTGIVTANGAYAQTTGSNVVLASITVPGGAMGANGALRLSHRWFANNNANNKFVGMNFGGQSAGASGVNLASSVSGNYVSTGRNRGAQNVQTWPPFASDINTNSNAPMIGSVDTSVAQVAVAQVNMATATDYVIFEGYTIELLPSA